MRILIGLLTFLGLASPALAVEGGVFQSVDGGTLSLDDWAGQPVLVVNTASLCAFSDQYTSLQGVYDTYRDAGLVVLAVLSNDFNQELDTAAEAKDYCELTYGIDMPMTDITTVRGDKAHRGTSGSRKRTGSCRDGTSTRSCWTAAVTLRELGGRQSGPTRMSSSARSRPPWRTPQADLHPRVQLGTRPVRAGSFRWASDSLSGVRESPYWAT